MQYEEVLTLNYELGVRMSVFVLLHKDVPAVLFVVYLAVQGGLNISLRG